ncbi:WXG100 family type VII secretion target [Microbacterium trichothecenolyticum]|uniref:ESAT-6-like protein n=1 Tax=Microbacterium trichothecenolyticum TaxID=69370 RepID=A0ABU0TWK1_MICTR|nr:WXG100 family type VII secretion target [Microbacterium trichothecenolyticum]MDQ1124041.1 WXG100 family type VII secretion target [Microbacterium trichothecenolyticum]
MPTSSTPAGSYSMNTESLRALQSSLAESVASIERELGSLGERLDALSGEWSGEAFDAYQRAQFQWGASMRRLNTLLDRAGGLAGASVDHHLAARTEVAALWT